jgi:UDP-N-acetylmuramoyl-L-alanyl-D-glutamate--2,6-diaminopimelate ligase
MSMIAGDVLVAALPHVELRHWHSLEIRGIQCDSRRIVPGDLFVAVPGVAVDGHRFVPNAIQAGAAAFIVERMLPELNDLPTAIVPNAREALAYAYAAFNDFPARKLRVIGVTGTDGKTTTTRLVAAILQAAGKRVGRIDTVGATIGEAEVDTGFHTTTPDAPEVQRYLAQMVAEGMEYAVIESTSHGLAQYRVAACEYDVAVATNITHEHLDFHGNYESYRDAKALLFRALSTSVHKPGVSKVAVLNADDSSFDFLRAIPAEVQFTYGLGPLADVTATELESSPMGLRFCAITPGGAIPLSSSLVGHFNVYNILAAVSVACSQRVAPEAIQAGVANMRGVPGRMENIGTSLREHPAPFTVILDFAHTPNALENALQTVRELATRQVIVVFGCAGLRDRAKRPWMGEVAGRLADTVIITAEDPRTESLEGIMEEIAVGSRRAGRVEGHDFWRIGDRGRAILYAIEIARPGDLVLVTGKGHETSMCIGTTEYPWSDRQEITSALRHWGYS